MAQSDNYIYAYDEENQKIILIDGRTGERIRSEDDRVTSLLSHLQENGEEGKLRKFSVWCAHQANDTLKPIQARMFDLAEKAISGEEDTERLKEMYKKTEGTAVATDTVGLQQGSSNAAAFLASRECVNPDAYEGALQAARFHRLWTELKEKESDRSYLTELTVKTSRKKFIEAEQQQVDHLLELLG